MTTQQDIALALALEMVRKSGVKEWQSPDTREAIALSAVEMAAFIFTNGTYNDPGSMAVTATFREQVGTTKTWKSSGGDAAITLTSLSNGSYREGAKLDLGATFGQVYAVYLDVEIAATPTAGNTIDLYWNPSSSATAGTDNRAGCGGTDASYTGYSSNATASIKQLEFIGSAVCTAQATTTVQKMFVGYFSPAQRYGSPVLGNNSGAALHSSATNMQLVFVPIEFTSE